MSVARPKANRSGFTLVELLVVITIIGLMAGLLTVGLYSAFGTSKNFVIAQELNQVAVGIEAFQQKVGVYPPDMQSLPAFNTFVSKAYPRCDRNAVALFVTAAGNRVDPAEALVLFLAYTSSDSRRPFGFAMQMAVNPVAWQAPTSDLVNYYKFPAGSLQDMDGDGFPEFCQRYAKGAPVLYFDARSYAAVATYPVYPAAAPGTGSMWKVDIEPALQYAVHYRRGTQAYEPVKYQLISAGQNGEFGCDASDPTVRFVDLTTGVGRLANDADSDNIANFTGGQTFDAFLTK